MTTVVRRVKPSLSLSLYVVTALSSCMVPPSRSESPSSKYLMPWQGWDGSYADARPTPETLEDFRLTYAKGFNDYSTDAPKPPGPCDDLRVAVDAKFKGIEEGKGAELDEGVFDVTVDPSLPIERGTIGYPLATSLAALGRPVTITARMKGRPDVVRTFQHTFGTDCYQTIRVDHEVGVLALSGDEGNSATSSRGASGGTDGSNGQDGGVIEAEAAWVDLAGQRHVLVVARVQDRNKHGELQPPRTVIAVVSKDNKVTLDAAGQAGGDGGDGGYGGCNSNGGDGGDGGNGGRGGSITLRVSDKSILDSMELDAAAGRPGKGGDPGKVESGCGRLVDGSFGKEGKPGAKAGTVTTKVVPAAQLSLLQEALASNKLVRVL